MAATKQQITPVAEVSPETESRPFNETFKGASYGATSSGKTLLIGDLIERFGAQNVGVISCERGLSTIRSLLDERYVRIAEDKAGLRSAWQWAAENFGSSEQWVCVDGGTRALNWVKDEVFGLTQRAYESYLSGIAKKDLDRNLRPYAMFITSKDEMDTRNMWSRVGADVEMLLNSFVRLPSNMYWTFWETQTWADAYTKGPPWRPDTPGNNALDAVKGTFDFVFRLEGEDGKRSTAHFRGNQRLQYMKTRDDWRAGVRVPDVIQVFNLADFATLVKGLPTT